MSATVPARLPTWPKCTRFGKLSQVAALSRRTGGIKRLAGKLQHDAQVPGAGDVFALAQHVTVAGQLVLDSMPTQLRVATRPSSRRIPKKLRDSATDSVSRAFSQQA